MLILKGMCPIPPKLEPTANMWRYNDGPVNMWMWEYVLNALLGLCDVSEVWLIVLLLLRTLFRQPPGPFSIHPLSVCTAAHKFYSTGTCWELKQLLYWWIPSYKEEHHSWMGNLPPHSIYYLSKIALQWNVSISEILLSSGLKLVLEN